jgi:serine/threonine-protein kinase ATR
MGKIARKVAAYQWYTCYPQIISRICHRQPEVYALLEEITLQVLVTYPQQAMWSMIGMRYFTPRCVCVSVCVCFSSPR